MAVAMTRNGETIRVEWLWKWYLRLPSLPFLAGSLYFLWYAALIVKADVSGLGRWSDDWGGLLFCIGFALLVGAPGLILAHAALLHRTGQVAPADRHHQAVRAAELRSQHQFSDFKFISIVDDRDED